MLHTPAYTMDLASLAVSTRSSPNYTRLLKRRAATVRYQLAPITPLATTTSSTTALL